MQTPPKVKVTPPEAIALAIEGLRELVELKYHFDHRMAQLLPGEKLPHAVKAGLEKREQYLAAVAALQGEAS